ncbi:MAG TPA: trigger factor [Xanthobacteraceae bacterium]|nr:trigger factor [Xanthobacteraceae bacterium]
MQVTETLSDGLKREYKVVVPAADLEAKVNDRLIELKDRVRINGFRPGKVPVAHLRRLYGRAVMAEAIEVAVQEANAKIISDHGFKLARDPDVNLPTEQGAVEQMMAGKSDLAYTVALEILPTIELADFKAIKLEKPVADVTEDEVNRALMMLVESNRPFVPKQEGAVAGDRVTVSFVGKVDGEPFEGGTAEDLVIQIGSGFFLPGFEDQLVGIKAGETRQVIIKMPANYPVPNLAGKDAVFELTAKTVEARGEVTVDDAFAKSLGLESLDKLREMVRESLGREHALISRQRVKRALLDELDKLHKFDAPPTMIEDEFNHVWKTVTDELEAQKRTFADEGTTEEAARAEYRAIAERRVRLGLVLAEIGERNGIKVTDEELKRAVVEEARRYPGREQEVWDYYRKNPQALAGVRAPLFEDKVVDFILELAQVTEKKVTRDQLYKGEEADEAA